MEVSARRKGEEVLQEQKRKLREGTVYAGSSMRILELPLQGSQDDRNVRAPPTRPVLVNSSVINVDTLKHLPGELQGPTPPPKPWTTRLPPGFCNAVQQHGMLSSSSRTAADPCECPRGGVTLPSHIAWPRP